MLSIALRVFLSLSLLPRNEVEAKVHAIRAIKNTAFIVFFEILSLLIIFVVSINL